MKVEELYRDDHLILRHVGSNRDFIEFLSKRAVDYSVHPLVDEFAEDHWNGKPESLFVFAQKVIKYQRDPKWTEKVHAPMWYVKRIREGKPVSGDCDDKTLFLATLLINRGYEVRLVGAHQVTDRDKSEADWKRINHVYLEFKEKSQMSNGEVWVPADGASTSLRLREKSGKTIPLIRFQADRGLEEVSDVQLETRSEVCRFQTSQ